MAAALAARQQQDSGKLAAWHEAEARQLDYVLSLEIKEKMEAQAALHAAERDRFARDMKEKRSGIEGFIDALQNRLHPGRGAGMRQAREQERRQLYARQARERQDLAVLLEQNKAEELDALKERHAQQRREQAGLFEDERKRYAGDAERARRLLERIEEERRQREQQERQQGRGPEGPPGRAK